MRARSVALRAGIALALAVAGAVWVRSAFTSRVRVRNLSDRPIEGLVVTLAAETGRPWEERVERLEPGAEHVFTRWEGVLVYRLEGQFEQGGGKGFWLPGLAVPADRGWTVTFDVHGPGELRRP